jgi:hypothetical protein
MRERKKRRENIDKEIIIAKVHEPSTKVSLALKR